MELHKDRDKDLILHTSRKVRRKNIRIMTYIEAMFSVHSIWLQDYTQAYIQEHDLQLEEYVKPAEKFNLPQDPYLKLLKPLHNL